MAKKVTRYQVLSVRVTDEERDEIRQAARAAGMTTDAFIYVRLYGRGKS